MTEHELFVLRHALYPDDEAQDAYFNSLKGIHFTAMQKIAQGLVIHSGMPARDAFDRARRFLEESARQYEEIFGEKLTERVRIYKGGMEVDD